VGIVTEDIERVRSSTDLVALVSEKVALRRVGTRWVGLCPFHGEKTPSLSVNGELGFYYCFGCGARGDAISFLRETEHLDFVTAVEALAGRAGVSVRYDREDKPSPAGKRAVALAEAMEKAVSWYHQRLLSAPDAAGARAYLRGRGYDADAVRHFRLGWAPAGWDALIRQAGIPTDLLEAAGLALRNQSGRLNDSFRGRVLFPIMDAAGRAVGLGGRVLPGADGPKYKNTSSTPIYDKGKILYGLNWAKGAIVERGRVVVCEGYTDVIGLHRAGVTEAVATCGTALAEGHVKLLTGFSRRIVLAYDADAAGQGAAERFYDWERRFDADISVVSLPAGADPGELAQKDPEALRQAVGQAQPYLGFRLARLYDAADLRNPEGRARTAEIGMALISEHPDPLVRDQYVMQLSDRCHLSPEQLRDLARHPSSRPAPGPGGARASRAGPGGAGSSDGRARPQEAARAPVARATPPAMPLPELEALRLAVHHPGQVAGRLHVELFGSELARAAFNELASSQTLYEAIENAQPQVADLLGQLAVVDSQEDPDDVLCRLAERAAGRFLSALNREARSNATVLGPAELAERAERSAAVQLSLQGLREVAAGPGYLDRLRAAERQLVQLLLVNPSLSPGRQP
jgi:DNA primase